MTTLLWLTEGTWEACVDAARTLSLADVTVLHVLDDALIAGWAGGGAGLLGRGRSPAGPGPLLDAEAALLDAAVDRLGVPVRRETRRGRVEREVVAAAAGVDLLVCARDGDRRYPGPHSLGPATRFVVDHAPCAVLLVWPRAAPTGATSLALAGES